MISCLKFCNVLVFGTFLYKWTLKCVKITEELCMSRILLFVGDLKKSTYYFINFYFRSS